MAPMSVPPIPMGLVRLVTEVGGGGACESFQKRGFNIKSKINKFQLLVEIIVFQIFAIQQLYQLPLRLWD
jgi:hypothetical protein